MLNAPVRGKETTGNYCCTSPPCWIGLQLPDDCLLNIVPVLPLLSSILLSLCVLSMWILPQHNGTLFSFCRATLRLGGNWRSTVRHILCWVSLTDLLIHVISKHSSFHHRKRCKLFYHTCSPQIHITHKCISQEGWEHECILHCLVYISSGLA